MTERAQQIAIAEACGWTQIQNSNTMAAQGVWTQGVWKGYPPKNALIGKPEELPNFIHDLNAMHEAEKILGDMQIKNYVAILTERSFVQDGDITRIRCWEALHATAAQRAEAFLRVIGKWEERDK